MEYTDKLLTALSPLNRFSQDMTLVDMPLPMSFMMSYGRK